MLFVLVNPPNHQFDLDDLAPPLGLLRLAQELIENGFEVQLHDFNLASCCQAFDLSEDFYPLALHRIRESAPDVVCFTSMGINSHIAIELARRIKLLDNKVITVFGGPHFSSLASDLQLYFPWIDYVVVGAGETALIKLATCLSSRSSLPSILREDKASSLNHPWDAYTAVSLSDYFAANPRQLINFETGRGCKLKCPFCYSPSHWRFRYDASVSQSLRDFHHASSIGVKHMFLVQDNMLNDTNSFFLLAEALANDSNIPTWNCYGTLRDIDATVAASLAAARCTGIYIGVDAVTRKQKRYLGKASFRDQSECIDKVRMLSMSGVCPTCAFILDPLDWNDDELKATLCLAAQLRTDGAEISLHVLTPYSATQFGESQHASPRVPDDFRLRLMFDCPQVVIDNPLAKHLPHFFPFHTTPKCSEDRFREGVAMLFCAQHLLTEYPFEMLDLLQCPTVNGSRLLRSMASGKLRDKGWSPIERRQEVAESFENMLCQSYGYYPVS